MTIYITDRDMTCDVALRQWCHGQWSPDIFQELETNAPNLHPPGDHDADAAMTSAEYRDLVEWWESEVCAYNERRPSWFTENLSEDEARDEWDRVVEYSLDADEV